ncbi:MAG: methylmalonyl-CoA epimerase [Calditrichaeota bacterium]|nr:methylmalonyl-CoA epimerase [Calditrichota bacterium]RQW08153.1 MAG: methylmalonyl-CoA epimerase [Calditrichota bacterium]
MLEKIDHIGIAVNSVNEVKSLFKKIFNLEPLFEEEVSDQKVRVVGFKCGDSNLEFLEPLNAESPIARYLEKRGEGLHHVAVGVKDIDEALNRLKSTNVRLIDENPRMGAEGKKIAFVHPKSVFGILLELSQE